MGFSRLSATPLPETPTLPEFPVRDEIPVFIERGTLRCAVLDDMPFLRDLYRSHRSGEFASLGWPVEQTRAFLDQQFDFQHRAYLATFPEAAFLLILSEGAPVGRIYVDFSSDPRHLIEIGLVPERRNVGIGTMLILAIQHQARSSGATGVSLHVGSDNEGAQRFYRRLGFEEIAHEGAYARMKWAAAQRPGSPGDVVPAIS
ncbi:MAG: GNAT family N-acetyltransferase [Phyllobacterium sp.]